MSTDTQDTQIDHKTNRFLRVFKAGLVLLCAGALAYFIYSNVVNEDARFPFHYGLDLAGGSQLTYEADLTGIPEAEVSELMDTLRLVIERRVNVFGVSEPNVQVEQSSVVAGEVKQRLIVELPGGVILNTS